MRQRISLGRIATAVALVLAGSGAWALAMVPSGFGISELIMFAGPGMTLAIALSWAANALTRERWTWMSACRSAAIGGVVFPPVVGFFVAWSGTLGPSLMVAVFVLTSWCVIGAGLLSGLLMKVGEHRRRREPGVHLTLVRGHAR